MTLEVQDSPSGIRTIALTNPAKRNAIDFKTLWALRDALTENLGNVRALLVRSSTDEVFCSGYDLDELDERKAGGPLPDDVIVGVLDLLSNHRLPSVALIQGPAYGAGCELSQACDVRVGSVNARFCMPPLKLGLVYSVNGIRRIANRTGPSNARFLFLSGAVVDAGRAIELGLLDLVSAEATSTALTVCEALAAVPLGVIDGTKAALSMIEGDVSVETKNRYETLHAESFDRRAHRG